MFFFIMEINRKITFHLSFFIVGTFNVIRLVSMIEYDTDDHFDR